MDVTIRALLTTAERNPHVAFATPWGGFCWVVLICLKNFRLWSVKRHVWGRCGLLYDARTCPAGAVMTTSTESHTAITC